MEGTREGREEMCLKRKYGRAEKMMSCLARMVLRSKRERDF